MRKLFFLMFALLMVGLSPASGFAQDAREWLPLSGVKSPYAPLAVPTTLKPVQDSLASLLNKGYQITTMAEYAHSGALFTLIRQNRNILCVLTAPTPGTDQNVPTSRCWRLNELPSSRQ